MTVDSQKADLFFRLVSHRSERNSIMVIANQPFYQRGQVFGGDGAIAVAMLDRLLHHSDVVATKGLG